MIAEAKQGAAWAAAVLALAATLALGVPQAWALTKHQCEERRNGDMKRIEYDYQRRIAEAARMADSLSRQAQAERNPQRKKELERQAHAARQRVNGLRQEKSHRQDDVRQRYFNCLKAARP